MEVTGSTTWFPRCHCGKPMFTSCRFRSLKGDWAAPSRAPACCWRGPGPPGGTPWPLLKKPWKVKTKQMNSRGSFLAIEAPTRRLQAGPLPPPWPSYNHDSFPGPTKAQNLRACVPLAMPGISGQDGEERRGKGRREERRGKRRKKTKSLQGKVQGHLPPH